MKKNVLKLNIVLLSFLGFSSCLGDNESKYMYVSYGVIQNVNSSNDYEILTDKGNTLKVTQSHTIHSIEDGKRVLANFEIVSDNEKGNKIYEVSVNGFYNLLSKPVVNESFILQDKETRRDSIGNDPFNRIYAAFGGNYINIDFEVLYSPHSDVKHLVNLVYDDTRADSDTLYLSLFHNAYGEIPEENVNLVRGVAWSSFKISDLLPEGVTSKPVTITWTEYTYNGAKQYSSTGIYKLNDVENSDFHIGQNFDNNSSLELK